MNIKFLTTDTKKKYMDDFNNNVLTCKDSYWGIDSGLKDILININQNKNVQTLYSKKYKGYPSVGTHPIKGTSENCSYLYVAFSEEITQLKIERIKQVMDSCFGDGFFMAVSQKQEIDINEFGSCEGGNKMSFFLDKSYFNIANICFTFESNNKYAHNYFWSELNRQLSNF